MKKIYLIIDPEQDYRTIGIYSNKEKAVQGIDYWNDFYCLSKEFSPFKIEEADFDDDLK